jgi:beta-N-acetylhexosaminidase
MSLEQQVGKLFVFGFHGTTAPDYLLDWLRAGKVGGIILFARNCENPKQLLALTTALHEAAAYPILIGIDQEGGTVARLREGFLEAPSAMALSNSDDPLNAKLSYEMLGAEMRMLGINWDYAPVVDITYNRENPTVGARSFGTHATRVGRFARQAVAGLQSAKVAACAKHFPGLGNTIVDTHLALPTLDTPLEHLLAQDILPYREVIAEEIASIMTTHTTFTALDHDHPATLSNVIVKRLLREEMHYTGTVITDCMEMKAIADNYGAGESAIMAVLGEIDMVLFSHTREMQEVAYDATLEAVKSGRIPMSYVEQANARRQALMNTFQFEQLPTSLEQVNSPIQQTSMAEIAQQGISLLKGHNPEMEMDRSVAFVEFASSMESEVMESGGATGIKQILDREGIQPAYIALKPYGDEPKLAQALELAKQSKITIICTRNAHLLTEQAERARQIAEAGHVVVHVCLRNPYDEGLIPAETVLATCGDSRPSLEAMIDVLRGDVLAKDTLRFEKE